MHCELAIQIIRTNQSYEKAATVLRPLLNRSPSNMARIISRTCDGTTMNHRYLDNVECLEKKKELILSLINNCSLYMVQTTLFLGWTWFRGISLCVCEYGGTQRIWCFLLIGIGIGILQIWYNLMVHIIHTIYRTIIGWNCSLRKLFKRNVAQTNNKHRDG